MLGELIGESSGKVIGYRVLSTGAPSPKVEVSFQGRGTLLGQEMADIGTYCQISRPGGIYYGEGEVLMTTPDGGVAPWRGFGVGKPTGPVPAGTFAVCGAFENASPQLARLNTVATVAEYDVDRDGNYRWRLWEWKSRAGAG
jgi:hypothetical protein